MNRRLALTGLLALFSGLMLVSPVRAQTTAKQAQDRYNKQTKGTSIDDYVRALESDDPTKRLQAVKSLEESKDKKAIDFLLQALGDQDMRVKAKAIDALGNLRATESTPVLIQHLFLRSTDTEVKNRILASLGKIGDANSAAPIAEFLQRDLNQPTRGTAIFALGEIGSPESLTILGTIEEKDDSPPQLRRLAKEAASKIRYHQSLLQVEAKEPQETFLKSNEPQAPPQ